MIHPERVRRLNNKPIWNGRYVLYWMQSAQRVEYNHALEFAIEQANELRRPVVVLFCLVDSYPEANERHYFFMLEGLVEVRAKLEEMGVRMVVRRGMPTKSVAGLAEGAGVVVVDGGYLRIQRSWRRDVAKRLRCAFYEVETNLIVPVTEASGKEEFSAGTFRPKVTKKLNHFLTPLQHRQPQIHSLDISLEGCDIRDTDKVMSSLDIDRSVGRATGFRGGTSEAKGHLRNFVRNNLEHFAECRNDPCTDCASDMSPYLHFGQISPLYIALEVMKKGGEGADAYLEELIVRRELSHNFVFYNAQYDTYSCLHAWSRRTLAFHRRDKREYVYSTAEFEEAKTHDPYWNAAQRQMMLTGKMHGYMRMYWGKKILEWSKSPETAYNTAIYLNNKYELDGRDANAYAGVAWCFGKHDRAWGERAVFGKVRYMNAAGLRRKYDADKFVRRVEYMNEGL